MRKLISAVFFFCFLTIAGATPPVAITNYYVGTVRTPGGAFTNAGNSGLATGIVYVCVPVAAITNAEFTGAMVTNDVRAFLSGLVQKMKTRIDGFASSNRFSTYTIDITTRYGSGGTNRTVYRAITEQQSITVTPTYESE